MRKKRWIWMSRWVEQVGWEVDFLVIHFRMTFIIIIMTKRCSIPYIMTDLSLCNGSVPVLLQ